MTGGRIPAAGKVVEYMLKAIPKQKATFNIFSFAMSATSVLPGGRGLAVDTANINTALALLPKTATTAKKDTTASLDAVLKLRDTAAERCSIIVLSNGLDWAVPSAMKLALSTFDEYRNTKKMVRVFFVGQGMVEGLARAGAGAWTYIGDSQFLDLALVEAKAKSLCTAINRAPVKVMSIDWGVTTNPLPAGGTGAIDATRPRGRQAGDLAGRVRRRLAPADLSRLGGGMGCGEDSGGRVYQGDALRDLGGGRGGCGEGGGDLGGLA